jgi:hypothetical protein
MTLARLRSRGEGQRAITFGERFFGAPDVSDKVALSHESPPSEETRTGFVTAAKAASRNFSLRQISLGGRTGV